MENMGNKYTIFDVAKWFLGKESMTHKKLQKLCYYAKAWSLVLTPENPFVFPFEAWVHGPVNRILWDHLKGFGYCDITEENVPFKGKDIDEQTCDFLESVWNTYGEFTGFQLENLTHSEEPWKNARIGLGEFEPSSNVIKNKDMINFYGNLISGESIGE